MEENNSQTQDTEGQPNTQVQEPQPVKPQKKKSDIWVRIGVGILYMAILIRLFHAENFRERFPV